MARRGFFFFILFPIALLVAGGVPEAKAADLFISPHGSDLNPGTIAAPFGTVRHAISRSSSGDRIFLREGRYPQTRFLWLDKSNLTITSYPNETGIISGSTTDTTNLQSVLIIAANDVKLINLEIQGGSFYAVKVEASTGVVVRGCRIGGSGRDCIKTFNADNLLIEDCEIGPSGLRDPSNAEGIDVIGSRGVTIRRCHIHDTATNGVYVKGGTAGAIIERNFVERTGHAGILLGQDTDAQFMRDGVPHEALNSVARNNIVYYSGGAGVGTYSGFNVRFENNTLVDVARTYHAAFYVVTNRRGVQSERVSFKNNIVVIMSNRPLAFVREISGPLASDSNIWFRPNGGAYRFSYETATRGFYWDSFAAWQTGMGTDARSLVADPRLVASDLFMTADGSPAIDSGEVLPGITDDYSGVARPQGAGIDMGAHERPFSNQPPTVSISASPTSGVAPLTVRFAANASDADGGIVSHDWSFGDGGTSTEISPSNTYRASGVFTARVIVTDDHGATATASVAINVGAPGNLPPRVSAFATPSTGIAPLSVRFEAAGEDPDGKIVGFAWNFDDGNTSTRRNPTNVYESPGLYTARVTVIDDRGATASADLTITVTAAGRPVMEPVEWTNSLGVAVAGNSLTKTAPSTWGNAGASSVQKIHRGDGFVEFTAAERNRERVCGLSNDDPDQHYRSILYGIHLNTGGAFHVVESGISRGYFGDYARGDLFKISVVSGIVSYSRNGRVFYTSSVAPTFPLLVDSSLNGNGATITTAIISYHEAPGHGEPPSTPPKVRLLDPIGGEVLVFKTAYDIIWTTEGTDIVRHEIYLSVDGGKSWSKLATLSDAEITNHSWMVPKIKTSQCRIKIVSMDAGGRSGEALSDSFTIANSKKAAKLLAKQASR